MPDETRDCPQCLAKGLHTRGCSCVGCVYKRTHGGVKYAQQITLDALLCGDCDRDAMQQAADGIDRMAGFMRNQLAFVDWLIEHGRYAA